MKTLTVLCALLTAGHIRAREIPYSAVVNYKKHMAKIYMRDIPVKIKLDGKKVAGIVNCTMESINFEGHAHLNMTITSDDFEDLLSFSVLVKAANPHTFNFYSNKWGSEGMDLLDVYSYNSERVGKKIGDGSAGTPRRYAWKHVFLNFGLLNKNGEPLNIVIENEYDLNAGLNMKFEASGDTTNISFDYEENRPRGRGPLDD